MAYVVPAFSSAEEYIPGCIAEQPSDVRPCAINRTTAFTRYFGVRERVAAEVSGAGVIDLISRICPGMPCQVIRNRLSPRAAP